MKKTMNTWLNATSFKKWVNPREVSQSFVKKYPKPDLKKPIWTTLSSISRFPIIYS